MNGSEGLKNEAVGRGQRVLYLLGTKSVDEPI